MATPSRRRSFSFRTHESARRVGVGNAAHVGNADRRLSRVVSATVERLEGRQLLAAQPTLQLMNAATDKVISTLNPGMTVNLSQTGSQLSVKATPAAGTKVGSMVFQLDGKILVKENYAPYGIAGDNNGDLNAWKPSTGNHTLQVLQYSGSNGSGSLVTSKSVSFTVTAGTSTTPPPTNSPTPPASGGGTSNTAAGSTSGAAPTLTLNRLNGSSIRTISGSTSVATGDISSGVTILASPSGKAGSIIFKVDGKIVKTENGGPYGLTTEVRGGGWNKWSVGNGSHTVQALVYSGASGQGTLLGQRTVVINVGSGTSTGGNNNGGSNNGGGTGTPAPAPPTNNPTPPTSGGGTSNGAGNGTGGSTSGAVPTLTLNRLNGSAIRTIAGSTSVTTGDISSGVTILASPSGKAGSVLFKVDGKLVKTENGGPYGLTTEARGGGWNMWSVGSGAHTVQALVYSGVSGQGTLLGQRTVVINVGSGTSTGGGNTGGSNNGGGTGTPTPAPGPSLPATPPPAPAPGPVNGGSVQAVIGLVAGRNIFAGHAAIVNATQSRLPNSALNAKYQWDFGDPSGAYNKLPGWTAGHIYDRPGTYNIRLTVTDANGQSSSASTTITVQPDNRKTVYVNAASGNDSNPGTINAPIRSFEKATALARSGDIRILFQRGQTWNTQTWLSIVKPNTYIGAYGSGSNPVLNVVKSDAAIQTFQSATNATIENLTFDSPYKPNGNIAGNTPVGAIRLDGTGIAVRNCTFLNLTDAINSNHFPDGVIVQDNDAPLATGLRGYFFWTQGDDIVILGNRVANSTRQHNIRVKDGNRLLIAYNDLTNLDRSKVDKEDFSKGTIEMQRGSWSYIYGNTSRGGPIRVGPRGEDTEPANTKTQWVVVENNKTYDYQINVYPGAHNVMIRNNSLTNNNGIGIALNPTDPQGRSLSNINIVGNTGHNSGTSGQFLRVNGGIKAGTITLANNTYQASKLHAGSMGTAPVYVAASNLAGFKLIANNTWPLPASTLPYAQGGVMWVNPTYTGQAGFKDPQEWLSYAVVKGDVFKKM